jgi:hypothetical protein
MRDEITVVKLRRKLCPFGVGMVRREDGKVGEE